MQKQAIVIGLGQFGMAVARALTARKVEVLAVDSDPARVRLAAAFCAEAASFDATDEQALRSTSPAERDVCVCGIGERNREGSIICSALLRQMGAKRIVARANSDVHSRILKLVGAHEVVNPEREFGERVATQLLYQGVKGELRLAEGVLITEADVPPSFVDQTLASLQLPRQYSITLVAVRRAGDGRVDFPSPTMKLQEGDVMVLVSGDSAVGAMLERC